MRKTWLTFFPWAVLYMTLNTSLIAFLPPEKSKVMRGIVNYIVLHPAYLVLILLALLVGAIIYRWPRTMAVYKDRTTDIRVIIECCDLLEQEGMKVIHTMDTFDSELERIVTPRSLHGAFIRRCQERNVALDDLIERGLKRLKPVSVDETLPGRTARYELGTICPLPIEGDHYCWAAFTHMQANGTITISKDEYIACLKRMWLNLSEPLLREETVNVAVMGNRFVDLPAEFSTEQKIDLMIQTFFAAAREKACCRTLRICVHSNNVPDIDFETYPTIIAHLAQRPII